jgi:alpha-1,2-mannosyltransferase
MRRAIAPARNAIVRLGHSRAAAALLALSIAGYLLVRHVVHASSIDLIVYREEGAAIRSGANLYGSLYGPAAATATAHATYPPFAAVLFVSLSYLPMTLLVALGVAANIGLLTVAVSLSCRLAGIEAPTRVTVCVAVAMLLWSEPIFTTLRYGQINLVLLVLILWDFTRAPGSRSKGIGVGLATGIKVTPAIFIVYRVITRRFREAATASATFAATVLISGAVVPGATRRFWTDDVFDIARVGRVENAANQSLRGLLVRMDHTRTTASGELLLIGALAVVGLACALAAYTRLGDAWGLPACAVTGLLVSPISWTHHWIWCIPITIVVWQHERRWLPALAVFWTFAVWAVPHQDALELHFNPVQTALSAWYILFGLAFLSATAVRIRQSSLALARTPQRDGALARVDG